MAWGRGPDWVVCPLPSCRAGARPAVVGAGPGGPPATRRGCAAGARARGRPVCGSGGGVRSCSR
eukprot:3494950-Alexandrium_andersonii.AAC.1